SDPASIEGPLGAAAVAAPQLPTQPAPAKDAASPPADVRPAEPAVVADTHPDTHPDAADHAQAKKDSSTRVRRDSKEARPATEKVAAAEPVDETPKIVEASAAMAIEEPEPAKVPPAAAEEKKLAVPLVETPAARVVEEAPKSAPAVAKKAAASVVVAPKRVR